MYEGNDGPNWGFGKYTNYDHGIPCQNKSCKSFGKPHPNCRCTGSMLGMTPEWYAPKGTTAYERAHEARNVGATVIAQRQAIRNAAGPKQEGISGMSRASAPAQPASKGVLDEFKSGMNSKRMMSKGGVVDYCSMTRAHHPDCEYYAEGGQVADDDPMETIGSAAVHHGILGLLSSVGKAKMQDPQKHAHVFEDAKTQHGERSAPMGEEFRKTMGHRLGNHFADAEHGDAAEKLKGHPLVGSIGKAALTPILERLAPAIIEKDAHPEAFRGAVDYLHSAVRGGKGLDDAIGSVIGTKGVISSHDFGGRKALKEKLSELRDNPQELMDVGGNLGHYLPEHHSALAGSLAAAVDYLNQLEPVHQQNGPFDGPAPADPLEQAKYDRAVDIAHQPLIALQRVKDGTIIPQDVQTIQTIYPKLYQAMAQKLTERIITARAKDEYIPYRQKQAMSLFLGQPLDFTMTPQAAQAIIQSAAGQQAQRQAEPMKKKASAAALNQINKTGELYALPTERREIDKKS